MAGDHVLRLHDALLALPTIVDETVPPSVAAKLIEDNDGFCAKSKSLSKWREWFAAMCIKST